jgi:hypothetical protein
MSAFRICKMTLAHHEILATMDFDNKEDAEHYAKNQSVANGQFEYEVRENDKGEFNTIKTYIAGEVVE